MGHDTPIAVLSGRPKLLYEYFKQNFAQVTNPPINPIREELVMSLVSMIGPRPNLLGRQAGTHKRLEVAQPILTDEDLAKIRAINELLDGAFRTATIDITWPMAEGAGGLEAAVQRICREATDCVLADMNILILSDRATSVERWSTKVVSIRQRCPITCRGRTPWRGSRAAIPSMRTRSGACRATCSFRQHSEASSPKRSRKRFGRAAIA